MKKLYYYHEKTLYPYLTLCLLLIFDSLYCYAFRAYKNEWYGYLLEGGLTIYFIFEITKSIKLLYKKRKCKRHGIVYDGKILSKEGYSTLKFGYFYRLNVAYKNGKFKTPLIQSKYVDKLKEKNCKVYEYNDVIYVDNFILCRKGESPINITISRNSNK